MFLNGQHWSANPTTQSQSAYCHRLLLPSFLGTPMYGFFVITWSRPLRHEALRIILCHLIRLIIEICIPSALRYPRKRWQGSARRPITNDASSFRAAKYEVTLRQRHQQPHNRPFDYRGASLNVFKMAWSKSTRITIMLAIDAAFFVLELGVGLVVGSLALMADAFHMVRMRARAVNSREKLTCA